MVVHIIHSSMSMPFLQAPSRDHLWLPQAGEKSFNDLWIKSNSFCHLREYFCESPSLRCLVMVSWQLSPRYFETMHHHLKRGIVAYQIWTFIIRFYPSPLMCVSCLSSRNVLYLTPWVDLECSISEEIDSCRVFLSFCRHHVGWSSRSKTTRQRCQC